jgi:TolB-like protein/tetratricopeptide (TPR) repeat protein
VGARRPSRRVALLAGGVGLLLAAAAGGAAWSRRARAPEPAGPRTVAVVPFENLGNPADLYFADGVTEEIASRLARVPGLTVLGRASALGLRGSGKSPEEVARALGAAYVLRGSVRWARAPGADVGGATTVRIVPALVSVTSGAEVWGEPYQAPLTDVFRVQTEVADRVAGALQATLGADARPARIPATMSGGAEAIRVAPAAYDAYLLGRHYWRKRGATNLRRAVTEFRRAVALDSGFARAWAGYADAYSLLPSYRDTTVTPDAARQEAERAARRAITLAPADPQGYVALASALQTDYEFRGALAALDEALARDSTDATAHQRRMELLQALGRLPEAEAAGRRALALDPLAPVINHMFAWVLLGARRDDEAIRFWRRAVELEPATASVRAGLVMAYAELGRREEAEAALPAAGLPGPMPREMVRGIMDARAAERGRAALRDWRRAVPDRTTSYALLAWLYAGFREPDSALAMLRRGAAAREPLVVVLLDDRLFDFLRADPRWTALVGEIRGP